MHKLALLINVQGRPPAEAAYVGLSIWALSHVWEAAAWPEQPSCAPQVARSRTAASAQLTQFSMSTAGSEGHSPACALPERSPGPPAAAARLAARHARRTARSRPRAARRRAAQTGRRTPARARRPRQAPQSTMPRRRRARWRQMWALLPAMMHSQRRLTSKRPDLLNPVPHRGRGLRRAGLIPLLDRGRGSLACFPRLWP